MIELAVAYKKHLENRPDNFPKPVVFFEGTAVFDTKMFEGSEVAHVRSINHPVWGHDTVRTSNVIAKHDDGSFETLNTIYKPYHEMMGT